MIEGKCPSALFWINLVDESYNKLNNGVMEQIWNNITNVLMFNMDTQTPNAWILPMQSSS